MYTIGQVEEWFYKAMELAPETRLQYLKNELGHDQKLLDAVLETLKYEQAEQSLFTRLVDEMNAELETETEPILDRYEIVEKVAAGGMAIVYKAKRVDGFFDQQVAIKVMRSSMIDNETTDRFRQERNVLARLQHANIAQIFDGGITKDDRPFFVMEYIDGQQLNDFVRHKSLSVVERLRLFLKICEAVKYAHQNLVIHGDIKPSNILVNERGEIKLTDFGISQLLDQQEGFEKRRLMTPEYASPEQINGQAIDIRSDVYQLGKVLKNLTGDLASKELSFISNKAIAEQADQRYEAVGQLITDIQSFLNQRPIASYSKSFGYTFGLFVKRNRLPVGLVATAVLILLASSVWYVFNITEARKEAEKKEFMARESLQFLVELFEQSDPTINQGDSTDVGVILSAGEAKINTLEDPETKAAILNTLGKVNVSLGNFEKADGLYREASDLYADLGEKTMQGEVWMGRAILEQARNSFVLTREYLTKAVPLLDTDEKKLQAYTILAVQYESIHRDTAALMKKQAMNLINTSGSISDHLKIVQKYELTYIGFSRLSKQKKDSVIRLKTNLVQELETEGSQNLITLAEKYENLSLVYSADNRYDSSVLFARRSLDIRKQIYDSANIHLTSGLYAMAQTYGWKGEFDSAVYYARQSLKIKQKWFGEIHQSQLRERKLIASLLGSQEELKGAEEMLKINFALSKQKYGLFHKITGDNLFMLLQNLNWQRKYQESILLYPQLLQIDSATYGKSTFSASSMVDYGQALGAAGFEKEAISQFENALEIYRDQEGSEDFLCGMALFSIANAIKQNQRDKALAYMDTAIVIIENDMAENHPRIAKYQEQYARLLASGEHYQKSNLLFTKAIQNYDVNYSEKAPKRVAYFQKEYAESLRKQGLKDSANVMMQLAEHNFERQRLMNK
ncbi:MAG: serine/threonine-protein kinase [Bacteroidota bacterium]